MPTIARTLAVLGCLGISSLAFSAIHTYETLSSVATMLEQDRPVRPIRETPAAPLAAVLPAASAIADADSAPSTPEVTSTDVALTPAPTNTIAVPDLVGMRLSEARRWARANGLRLRARTTSGASIAAAEGRYYRVRTQRTDAGTQVAPDDVVDVRVREAVSYGGGY